jgi:hypothetical protein
VAMLGTETPRQVKTAEAGDVQRPGTKACESSDVAFTKDDTRFRDAPRPGRADRRSIGAAPHGVNAPYARNAVGTAQPSMSSAPFTTGGWSACQGSRTGPPRGLPGPAQGRQDLPHRHHVEQIVVEHGNQPIGIAAPDVVVVEAGHLVARHVSRTTPAADVPLQGLEPAVEERPLPAPARGMEQVEVARRQRHRPRRSRSRAGAGTARRRTCR